MMSRKRDFATYVAHNSLGLKLTGVRSGAADKPDTSTAKVAGSDKVCELCRRIDFKQALALNVRGKAIGNGRFVHNLDYISQPSDCHICQFFREMRIYPPQRDSKNLHFSLVAFSALTQLRLSGLGIQDTVMLAVVGRSFSNSLSEDDRHGYSLGPYIMSSNEPVRDGTKHCIRGRSIKPNSIDCSAIVDWVDDCRSHHSKRCPNQEIHMLEGFRVIDCEMRQVVSAPENCEYIALSYVWGSSEAKKLNDRNVLPDETHPVIEDSIEVTMRLGFRYLWVDRYCIRHENVHESMRQICSMDSIYRESSLTIIAATSDSKAGLPGVGSTPRKLQPTIEVGGQVLVSTLPNPKDIIRKSAWNKRAWTFQEGLLSTKRLVFTDYDVYFQCMCKHFRETISLPLEPFHPREPGHLRRQGDAFQVFPRDGPGSAPADLMDRIQEYSQKSLSFSSDGLNAMLGIFKSFEQTPIRIWHLQGIPLFAGDPRHQPLPDHMQFTNQGLGRALTWTLVGDAKRNVDLPSWSWVGWSGFKKFLPDAGQIRQGRMDHHFYVAPNNINPCDKRPIIKIQCELKKGNAVGWEDLQYTVPYRDWTEVLSKVLQIRAWTFDVDVSWDDQRQQWKLVESLKDSRTNESLFERQEDYRSYEHLLEDRLLGVVVEMDYKPREQPAISFLLLKFKKDADLWERVDCYKIRGGRYWTENWPDEAWYGRTRMYRRTIRLG